MHVQSSLEISTTLQNAVFCSLLGVAVFVIGLPKGFAQTAATAVGEREFVDYARDIRPILSDACFHCHGPDEKARQADLRLDTHSGMLEDRGGYAAVVAGDTTSSELLSRVFSDDASVVMPPPESNKSLSDQQRNLLKSWIEQGAKWQQHWAFVAPVRPEVPLLTNTSEGLDALPKQWRDWPRNEIDFFVLHQQLKAGLSPNPDAEPIVLVRRLFLDLVGVQPAPAVADYWVKRIWNQYGELDEMCYQQLVSQLLASPQYGERWARRWLDLARYADTNGYEKDRDRTIWPYRDWVIAAINRDMPFDEFTITQIAGDMLPEATEEQTVATGFHRNTMINEEGGIDPLEFRYYAMTDRVATTGTTWLGLTLGCCQCHTHKYDPITHTEYYQLMALLNNADEPILEMSDASIRVRWDAQKRNARRKLDELARKWKPDSQATDEAPVSREAATESAKAASESTTDETTRLHAMQMAFDRWLEAERSGLADWRVVAPTQASSNLPILTIEADGSVFASGDTAKRDDYWLEFPAQDQPVASIRLEALPDERLPAGGPGSTYYEGTLGDFYLTEFVVSAEGSTVPIAGATESYAKNRYGNNPVSAALAIDGDVQTGWSVHDAQGRRSVAVFSLAKPISPGQAFQIQMTFGRHFASSLGRFRINVSNSPTPLARNYSNELEAAMRSIEPIDITEDSILRDAFLLAQPQFIDEAAAIAKLLDRPAATTTLVMRERPAGNRRPTYRHHRGEYLQPKEEVVAGVPEVLPSLTSSREMPTRLDFAKWLVEDDHPLTARVLVNRHWSALMGGGIVRTEEDFGLQGAPPTHPELLDWLAVSFREDDLWSVKSLHRKIVSSRTYRQSSHFRADLQKLDPNNRLLWRANRIRLDAEVLRDSLLNASGKLVSIIGGPPVLPPQPSGVTEVAYGSPSWPASQGAARYRRSIYTKIKRTAPFAMFATFDAPSGESCVARRSRSNSPLQALTILNDAMIQELATYAAVRAMADFADKYTEGVSRDICRTLFRNVLVRSPTPQELDDIEAFFREQAETLKTTQVDELLGAMDDLGKASEDKKRRLAALTATARALFGLDEVQVRD